MERKLCRAALGFALLVLAACGGGGGSGGGGGGGGGGVVPNRPPVAAAGSARDVSIGELVVLDGSASSDPDGNPITFAWTVVSSPASSFTTLSGATTATPSFRPSKEGVYRFSLVVSDGSLNSAAAETTVTATVNPGDVLAATSANLSAVLDPVAGAVELQWFETVNDAYRIEANGVDSSFQIIETIASLPGVSRTRIWRSPYVGPSTYRVVAQRSNREFPLQTSTGKTLLSVSMPDNPQIVVDKADPIVGPAQLSVTPAPAGSTVTWMVDRETVQLLGAGNPLSWPAFVPAGPHLLTARMHLGDGVYLDLARRIETAIPSAFPVSVARVKRGSTYHLFVSASSPSGVAQVQASLPGSPVQTLTARNSCGVMDCFQGVFTHYEFTFPLPPLIPGGSIPVVTISATDTTGIGSQASTQLPTEAGVFLTATPRAGAFVSGTLQLLGSFTTLNANPSTIKAYLGATKFLETTAQNFSGSLDLTGVTPGNHTLIVSGSTVGETIDRNIVVASNGLVHQPLFSIEDEPTMFAAKEAAILAAEGDLVLYRKANASVFVHNVATGADVMLAPLYTYSGELQLTADWVYGAGRGSDPGCKTTDVCIYRWSTTTGAVTNLSSLDPNFPPSSQANPRSAPRLRGGLLVWQNFVLPTAAARPFTIYDTSSGSFTAHITPGGVVQGEFAISAAGGTPTLVYFASLTAAPDSPVSVFKWSAPAGLATLATLPNLALAKSIYVDGGAAAYSYVPNNGPSEGVRTLVTTPLAGGASTTVFTAAYDIDFRDGILVWRQPSSGAVGAPPRGETALSSQQATTPLSPLVCPASPQRLGSGFLAYCKADGTYLWNGTTGASVLRVEGGPFPMFITGNRMYFKSGDGIYRVAIN